MPDADAKQSLIMEGIGSDDVERGPPTPLEEYMERGGWKKNFCCCLSLTNVLWSVFVLFVLFGFYVTWTHDYAGDQLALTDEHNIAHLNHMVHDLQRNQHILFEAVLQLAQQHEPTKQEKIAELLQNGIRRTNCETDPNNPLCKKDVSEDLLNELASINARYISHEQATSQ